ncbi:MAG: hypothetical protein ACTSRO_11320 [Candidatus Heimdallarchaeaceae archaeon]
MGIRIDKRKTRIIIVVISLLSRMRNFIGLFTFFPLIFAGFS